MRQVDRRRREKSFRFAAALRLPGVRNAAYVEGRLAASRDFSRNGAFSRSTFEV